MTTRKNPEAFKRLEDARKESDVVKREQMCSQVEKIAFEEAVRIPVVHSEPLLAQRANLSGWQPSLLANESFEAITKQ